MSDGATERDQSQGGIPAPSDDDGGADRTDGSTPDVYLHVPMLEVEEIELEVEDLRAHVSLQAEVLDLVKLNVGVDATLGRVKLGIRGVKAQATLTVRLDEVTKIIDRVLDTVDRNPEILERLTQGLGAAAEEVGSGAGEAVQQVGSGAGSAVSEIGEGAGGAVREVGQGAGGAVSDVGRGAGETVSDVGGTVSGVGESVSDLGESVSDVAGTASDVGESVPDVGESVSGVGGTASDVGDAVADVGDSNGGAADDEDEDSAEDGAEGSGEPEHASDPEPVRRRRRVATRSRAEEDGTSERQPAKSRARASGGQRAESAPRRKRQTQGAARTTRSEEDDR